MGEYVDKFALTFTFTSRQPVVCKKWVLEATCDSTVMTLGTMQDLDRTEVHGPIGMMTAPVL